MSTEEKKMSTEATETLDAKKILR